MTYALITLIRRLITPAVFMIPMSLSDPFLAPSAGTFMLFQ